MLFNIHITVYRMNLKNLLILFFTAFFFSCATPPKNIVYFQDLRENGQYASTSNILAAHEPIIKNFDELIITISAPVLDQLSVAQFNLPLTTYLTPGEVNYQQSLSVQTYIVDHDGTINYPVIGKISLAGLTKSQAIEHLRKLVSNYINNPIVTLKIISFNVTVLGEVLKPGTISVNQEKISVLDAIGAAGDLTIYGNRENVLLLRENNDGTLNHIWLDLTSSDLFSSNYFYLQQNDKIIVSPNKTRQLDSKYGVADSYRLSIFSMVFSAVSIIASTTIAIISLRKN